MLLGIYPLTWLHLRCDVGLEEGKYRKKTVLCYSIVYYYNGAQRHEQFLRVGRLCRALILLGLALCLLSASASSVFTVLYNFVCLHPSVYILVSWALWYWRLTWLTNRCSSVLYDAIGWVIWPVKSSTKWLMTSSGTLNPTVPYLCYISLYSLTSLLTIAASWYTHLCTKASTNHYE